MDIVSLESFVATVRSGSFSAAARELGIPKSTVANRVGVLEARLGSRLLERTTRRVRLTVEGDLLFQRGEQLILEARDLEKSFRERHDKPVGILRVSVPVLFEQEFMGRIAASYAMRHPEAGIEAVPDDQRVDLVREGFDCAVRIGPQHDSSHVTRTFAETRNIVVAAASLVSELGLPSAPSDMAHWPAIWHGRNTAGGRSWQLAQERVISVEMKQPRIILGSLHAARAAAIEGLGATLLPDFFVAEQLASGSLVAIVPRWDMPTVPLSIVYPSHRQPSPRLRAFIALMTELFKGRMLP